MSDQYADLTLEQLEAQFLRSVDEKGSKFVDDIGMADGVWFLCPKCFHDNGGDVGTHMVLCWSPKVPQSRPPTPGRWELTGTGLTDLTLVAGSSSIQLTGGCNAHFWIRNGKAVSVT